MTNDFYLNNLLATRVTWKIYPDLWRGLSIPGLVLWLLLLATIINWLLKKI